MCVNIHHQFYDINFHNCIDQVQSTLSPLMSNSDPYIYAQAFVLNAELALLLGDSLNSYVSILTQIANSCPLALGEAVYGARGLLESYTYQDIAYDDHNICQTSSPRSVKQMTTNYTISPNPNSGIFNITNTENVISITIRDQVGNLFQNLKINEKNQSLEIDLSDSNPGVYFVQLVNNTG